MSKYLLTALLSAFAMNVIQAANRPNIVVIMADDLVDFADMLPTLCEAVGIQVSTDRPMDGISFIPCLTGETTRKKPWVYVWYEGKVFARTKTEILLAKQDLTDMTFSVSKRSYEQTVVDPAKMTEEQKTSRQMLEKVLQDMAKTRSAGIENRKR